MTLDNDLAIEMHDVHFDVGETRILNGISLTVKRGDILILLGESGCGKTTTLKLINRLIEPTSGEVIVNGRKTTEWDPIELRRSIGYVLQDGGLFPQWTAGENVALPLTITGKGPAERSARSAEMLDLVGLEPARFADRFPHELSGGQRQRVGVARALASDPDILLLDEPFGALDAITRTEIQKEFARLARELGKTAVFVTHDLHEAMLLGTSIALMDKGRIVLNGPAGDFASSDLPLARAYLETVKL